MFSNHFKNTFKRFATRNNTIFKPSTSIRFVSSKEFSLCSCEFRITQESKRRERYFPVKNLRVDSDNLSRNVLISYCSFLEACIRFGDCLVRRRFDS